MIRLFTKEQSQEYIQYLWTSEDFLARDLKSTNHSQSSIFMSPKFTFFEKLLEKKQQREDQLYINTKPVMDKILPPQSVQSIPSYSEVPTEFLNLLELEIFNKLYSNNIFNTNSTRKQWMEFARWAHFTTSKTYYKQFRGHCRRLWAKILHAHNQQTEAQKKPLEHY
ncbi:11225_t:CDS:1, partial [Gigaspora rosea]